MLNYTDLDSLYSLFFDTLLINNRPLPPIIESFDSQHTMVSPDLIDLITETDMMNELQYQQQQQQQQQQSNNYKATLRLSESYSIRLPIETTPQKNVLQTTIAQILGIVKLIGCSI